MIGKRVVCAKEVNANGYPMECFATKVRSKLDATTLPGNLSAHRLLFLAGLKMKGFMENKEYILQIMYFAFLDMRAASHSQDSHTCFVLSDVFHTVPLQMNRADKGEMDYAEIVAGIKQKCEARNCVSWLVNVTAHIVKRYEQDLSVGEGREEPEEFTL